MWRLVLFCLPCFLIAAEKFVLVDQATYLDPYEISTVPVTNASYAVFVRATKHPAPQHWVGGAPPPAMLDHPVVFVNRYDVAAYLAWRTRRDNRIYRLPTQAEFEFAQRGLNPKAKYPWGDETPSTQANFDASGARTFGEWRKHLKPAGAYPPNPIGLYDMAGNVWQMVDSLPDPAIVNFKYRIESPVELENGLMGGSWARAAYYLQCGVRGGASPGIRHPDIGFRLVREPQGATHFQYQPRRLAALRQIDGRGIAVSWQLLPSDPSGSGFHVYRTTRRDHPGERLTTEPVTAVTFFRDTQPVKAGRVFYRVRPVLSGERLGPPSEWAALDLEAKTTGIALQFQATSRQGSAVPIFGDITGDGVPDAVLRLDNGIRETSRDPGLPVELEAFTSYGRSLWRRPLAPHDRSFGNANNNPVALWDMDGDGKSEVIARVFEDNRDYLAILDGFSGRTLRRAPWTPMLTDFSKSSTRIHLSIAYLDGETPAIITQTGLYENEILDAYDAQLRKLWQYRSVGETSGSGSHHVDICDVDGDGKDEVFNGTMLLNPNGVLRWALYREHPDIVSCKHILPGSPDRQVFFAVESSVHAGAYLVDAKTGRLHWKVNREDDPRWSHAHTGWTADIFPDSPGMEMLTNRDGHLTKDLVLFSARGEILVNPFPQGWRPVSWTGGPVRDLITSNGKTLGHFDGKTVVRHENEGPNLFGSGSCSMTADLVGDFRDEVVCIDGTQVTVYTNTQPPARREVTRTASREYRLWLARNLGTGYGSYFEWEP